MGQHEAGKGSCEMPMPKKFEDWTPIWVTKGEEFDADKAARFIYNLEVDKEKLGEQKATVVQERDAAVTRVTTVETALAAKAQEGETAEQKVQRLEQENAALRAAPAPGAVTPEVQQLRLAAAMSVNDSITAKAAMTLAGFIQGTTKEEAEASAKTFVETFGIPGAVKAADEVEDDDDDEPNPLYGQPRSTVNNPLVPKGTGGEKPVSELLGLIPRL